MLIGILADCHLGKHKFRKIDENGQNLYNELNNKAFKEAINILDKENVENIIIAGDLFDSPNPPVQSVILANEVFSNINKNIYLLGGNHDYSQINNQINIHSFDLLYPKNILKEYKNISHYELDDCNLVFMPYKFMKPEYFGEIYKIVESYNLKNNKNPSILIIHGYINLNNDENAIKEFALPKQVVDLFNLVVCGHIHLPNYIDFGNTNILTPGSLMPSSYALNILNEVKESSGIDIEPSVYTYNTETNIVKRIKIPNIPQVNNIIAENYEDLNNILNNIKESKINYNIYSIRYNGKMDEIDEILYKNAIQNSLILSIKTIDNKVDEINDNQDFLNFWDFISQNYPDYYDEFQQIKENV